MNGYAVVVGACNVEDGLVAFLWTETSGRIRLQDYLADHAMRGLEGWRLISAVDVSGDGLTIVGTGVNPDGTNEAYCAKVALPKRE